MTLYLKRIGRLAADVGLALLVIGASVAAFRWGVMALVEKLLPLAEVALTVVRRVGVTAVLIAAYWAVARYYEHRRTGELSFRPLAIALGAALGVALIGVTILALYALGNYRLLGIRGLSAALPVMVLIVLGVVFEEVVFRGVVFRLLERDAGTLGALVAQAPLFGVLHLFNEGTSAMTVISVTLLGALWASIYVRWRNLWVVVANHAAWNLAIFVTGLPLSGQERWRASAPLETSYQGPDWVTGGGFGPEDSILNVVVLAAALGVLLHRLRQRGLLRRGVWGGGDGAADGPAE